MLSSKLEESEESIEDLPPTRKLYIRDISEVFLELAPSTSFRVYLSTYTYDTTDIPHHTAVIPQSSASQEEYLEAGVANEESSDRTTPTINTQSTRYGTVVSTRIM